MREQPYPSLRLVEVPSHTLSGRLYLRDGDDALCRVELPWLDSDGEAKQRHLAQLFIAAPTLYQACEGALERLDAAYRLSDDYSGEWDYREIERAKNALLSALRAIDEQNAPGLSNSRTAGSRASIGLSLATPESVGRCRQPGCNDVAESVLAGALGGVRYYYPFCEAHERQHTREWDRCTECVQWATRTGESVLCAEHGGEDYKPEARVGYSGRQCEYGGCEQVAVSGSKYCRELAHWYEQTVCMVRGCPEPAAQQGLCSYHLEGTVAGTPVLEYVASLCTPEGLYVADRNRREYREALAEPARRLSATSSASSAPPPPVPGLGNQIGVHGAAPDVNTEAMGEALLRATRTEGERTLQEREQVALARLHGQTRGLHDAVSSLDRERAQTIRAHHLAEPLDPWCCWWDCEAVRLPGSPFCDQHRDAGFSAMGNEAAAPHEIVLTSHLPAELTADEVGRIQAVMNELISRLRDRVRARSEEPTSLHSPESSNGTRAGEIAEGLMSYFPPSTLSSVVVTSKRCVAGGCEAEREPGHALCAAHQVVLNQKGP